MEHSYKSLYLLSRLPVRTSIKSALLFHIFTGKRTASNLYHAKNLQLLPILGIEERLTRQQFSAWIEEWKIAEWVLFEGEMTFQISKEGQKEIKKYFSERPYPVQFHLARYGKAVNLFWKRIQLLTQVLSQKAYGDMHYDPIVRDREVQYWVKNWLASHPEKGHKELFGRELGQVLRQIPEFYAQWIAEGLTGFNQIGATSFQRAKKYHLEKEEEVFLFLDALHSFYTACLDDSSLSYLQFIALQTDQDTNAGVTASTYETVQLLEQGMLPSTISRKRRLKEGTIWEHGIEWSILHPSSSWTRLIPDSVYKKLVKNQESSFPKTYQELLQKMPDLSFAWYRLVEIERNTLYENRQHT